MAKYRVCLGPVAIGPSATADEGEIIELSEADGETLHRIGVVLPVVDSDPNSDQNPDQTSNPDSDSDSDQNSDSDQPPKQQGKGKK